MNSKQFNEVALRIEELVNMKTDQIRLLFTDLPEKKNYYQSNISRAREESRGWSKGLMIAEIIIMEFGHLARDQ